MSVQRYVSFVIRTPRAGSASLENEVQKALWSVYSNLPLAKADTVETFYNRSLARTSFTLLLLAIAGGMALLLGLVGIYGVISYSVSQRTREIGIRLALGAPIAQVTTAFVRSGLILSAIGCGCGLAGGAYVGAADEVAAVFRQCFRSTYIRSNFREFNSRGGTCQLPSGEEGD